MAQFAVERVKADAGVIKTDKELKEFLVSGLYLFGSELLLEANRDQQRLNPPSPPTSVKFDTRAPRALTDRQSKNISSIPINGTLLKGWRRKIRLSYNQTFDIFGAVVGVISDLKSLTRKLTGRGVGTYYFWCANKDNQAKSRRFSGNQLAGVKRWLDESSGDRVTISVIGPTVSYRRKLIYRPRGRADTTAPENKLLTKSVGVLSSRARGTSIDRIKGFDRDAGIRVREVGKTKRRVVVQFDIKQALQRIVVRRNKRRFKGVWMQYAFVPSKEALPSVPSDKGKKYGLGLYGNVPVIYIGGALRNT